MHSRITVNCPRMNTTFPDFALPVVSMSACASSIDAVGRAPRGRRHSPPVYTAVHTCSSNCIVEAGWSSIPGKGSRSRSRNKKGTLEAVRGPARCGMRIAVDAE